MALQRSAFSLRGKALTFSVKVDNLRNRSMDVETNSTALSPKEILF
jgi:hypothetical protein